MRGRHRENTGSGLSGTPRARDRSRPERTGGGGVSPPSRCSGTGQRSEARGGATTASVGACGAGCRSGHRLPSGGTRERRRFGRFESWCSHRRRPVERSERAGSAHLGRAGAGFPGDRRVGGGSDRHKGQIDDRDAHRRHLEARRSAGRVGRQHRAAAHRVSGKDEQRFICSGRGFELPTRSDGQLSTKSRGASQRDTRPSGQAPIFRSVPPGQRAYLRQSGAGGLGRSLWWQSPDQRHGL